MLDYRNKGCLIQIIQFCDRLEKLLDNISKDEYDDNLDYKEIACFNLIQIGELATKLSDDFVKEYNQISWKLVKGMRNIIVHNYGSIDYDIVWETSKKNIKELSLYCNNILKQNV